MNAPTAPAAPGAAAPVTAGLSAFFDELRALEAELRAELGEEDLRHLKRMQRISRACSAAGWATAWMGPNPVSVGLLSLGRTTRWAMIGHHVSHGGYDRVPGAPARLTREGFAKGARRLIDWLDVIQPEAWHVEHNQLHHARLGETYDPDLVEQNLRWIRESDMPVAARYAVVLAMASVWKWSYYAPSVLKEQADHAKNPLRDLERGRNGTLDAEAWSPMTPQGRALWLKSYLPYAAINFALLPALFMPLGPGAASSAAINSFLAELLTNLHTFVIITTNHAGEDVEAWDGPPADAREHLLRQILGSVNYRTGGDLNDLLHGWLNYQIEHHLWPDMSMLQYRRAQPRLKELCERHGVPYIQESVWLRLRKTLAVMVGEADMKRA